MHMMSRLFAASLLAVSFALPVMAEPRTYVIDDSHTYPHFSYDHFGLSKQTARFSNTRGSIEYDADAPSASLDIVIDMNSVDTGYGEFDTHLRSDDFFDTEQYPYARFRSTDVHFQGSQPTAIEGVLTIKGISQSVTLDVTRFEAMPHPMEEGKHAVGANAEVTVLRSDFDAGMYAPYVSDEVTISIAVEAISE